MLHGFTTPPGPFVDDVGQQPGEAVIDTWVNNAVVLDAASFRSAYTLASSGGKDTSTPRYYVGVNGERVWWGAFQYFTGMTTLIIAGWAQEGNGESFQLRINGAVKVTQAVPNGTTFTLSWTIAGLANGDIVEVEVTISGSGFGGSNVDTAYLFWEAYVTPLPLAVVWPGLPTFSGTYNAARCAQVSNAQNYLYTRLNALPMLPQLASIYVHASSVTGDVYPLWYGSVERSNGNDTMALPIIAWVLANVSETWRVKVDNTIVHTSAPLTAGDYDDHRDLEIDLSSFPANQRLDVRIEAVVTTGPALGPSGDRNSRYHIVAPQMIQTPATATPPADSTAGELLHSTTLDGRLNTIVSILNGVKTRLDNNPRIFDRVPLMRRMFGRNDNQYAVFAPNNTYALRFKRQGARLVVRGKGVKICWGAASTKAEKTTTTAYKVEFANNVNVTEGDAVETKTVYLDNLEGLKRGMQYFVVSESDPVVYAAEYVA